MHQKRHIEARAGRSRLGRRYKLTQHGLRGRGSFASVEATIEYDLSSRIGQVSQPLLVLGPHDDVWEHMEPLLPLLPVQAEFVDLPHVTSVFEVLTRHREEIAGYINRFLR